ncbi:MAG: hypothetical protein ACK54C_11005 [Betaproteobacteria bacterium]
MKSRLFAGVIALIAAVLAAGCATRATSIEAQWVSPAMAGRGKVQNVLVVAALRDSTQRRMLEDQMARALTLAGVKAVPSYLHVADTAQISEAQIRKAVADAGSAFVLVSSISGVTTDVRVTQQSMMGPGWGPGWGWHGSSMGPGWPGMQSFYAASWNRSITSDVRTTTNVHGDTRLFDARSSEVVWSAATRTVTGFDSVSAMIDQFSALMVETLRKDGLL